MSSITGYTTLQNEVKYGLGYIGFIYAALRVGSIGLIIADLPLDATSNIYVSMWLILITHVFYLITCPMIVLAIEMVGFIIINYYS